MVCVAPSTRTSTVTGAAPATGADAATMARAAGTAPLIWLVMATLSSRVVWLRPGPGLLASDSAPRLPGKPSASQWHQRRISARSQWRDRAGFAPDFPKPPADERGKHNRTDGRAHNLPLQSPADGPPSSRGLGRRPLTAETGVRIPVAVLQKPPPPPGVRRSGGGGWERG